MKKLFLWISMLLLSLFTSAQVEIDGIRYYLDTQKRTAKVAPNNDDMYSGNIVIPSSIVYDSVVYKVTEMAKAFYNCEELIKIELPNSIERIEVSAFEGCSNLISVTLPDSLKEIGGRAFFDCYKLSNIVIPEKVYYIGYSAFKACFGLTDINLPNSVKNMGTGVFGGCRNLKHIKLSENLESIRNATFSHCENIESIEIPNSVTQIEGFAFRGCSSLTSIIIPNGVFTISESVFSDCSNLRSVKLPISTQMIDDYAFHNCNNLSDVYCYAEKVPVADYGSFAYSTPINTKFNENINLHVPDSLIEQYSSTSPWRYFKSIKPLPEKEIKNIELAIKDILLEQDDTLFLTAKVFPSDIPNEFLRWESSNDSIAVVDSIGRVIAIASGTTYIIVSSDDGNEISDSCMITVEKKNTLITNITLNQTSVKLIENDTITLIATIYSTGVNDSSIIWESSNENVATINTEGQITAIAPGTATITAKANDSSGVSASCEVTVTPASYVITYLIDGEVFLTDTLTRGSAISLPEEPTKEGYTFSGWGEVPEVMPAKDMTIEGSFIVNKYLVTFKIGDEVIASDSLEYGANIVVPEAPEKEGYTFNGWGEVIETVPASDVTYGGSYTINTYKVYYYVDEELVHTAEVTYGEPIPEYIYEPTAEGDEFLGWIGETYATMPAHDVTYTANIESGINQITIDNGYPNIYDLTGRKVNIDDLEELSEGIYIINGRKVVVKIGM